MEADKVRGLKAQRFAQHTRALRLLIALDVWKCPTCGGSDPQIYCTRGAVRYVRCGCGHRDKIISGIAAGSKR